MNKCTQMNIFQWTTSETIKEFINVISKQHDVVPRLQFLLCCLGNIVQNLLCMSIWKDGFCN